MCVHYLVSHTIKFFIPLNFILEYNNFSYNITYQNMYVCSNYNQIILIKKKQSFHAVRERVRIL